MPPSLSVSSLPGSLPPSAPTSPLHVNVSAQRPATIVNTALFTCASLADGKKITANTLALSLAPQASTSAPTISTPTAAAVPDEALKHSYELLSQKYELQSKEVEKLQAMLLTSEQHKMADNKKYRAQISQWKRAAAESAERLAAREREWAFEREKTISDMQRHNNTVVSQALHKVVHEVAPTPILSSSPSTADIERRAWERNAASERATWQQEREALLRERKERVEEIKHEMRAAQRTSSATIAALQQELSYLHTYAAQLTHLMWEIHDGKYPIRELHGMRRYAIPKSKLLDPDAGRSRELAKRVEELRKAYVRGGIAWGAQPMLTHDNTQMIMPPDNTQKLLVSEEMRAQLKAEMEAELKDELSQNETVQYIRELEAQKEKYRELYEIENRKKNDLHLALSAQSRVLSPCSSALTLFNRKQQQARKEESKQQHPAQRQRPQSAATFAASSPATRPTSAFSLSSFPLSSSPLCSSPSPSTPLPVDSTATSSRSSRSRPLSPSGSMPRPSPLAVTHGHQAGSLFNVQLTRQNTPSSHRR